MEQRTFGSIEQKYADLNSSSILLQSFPYDGTSTWGKGADKGFAAFLDASDNMELYDIETDSEVYKHGIHLVDEIADFDSPEDMYIKTYNRAKELVNTNKFPTFFGGEHSISIGIIEAFAETYKNLTVLQIDAHADLRPSYNDTPYNHACAMYQASLNSNLIQVGIRSMDSSEKQHMNTKNVFFAHDIHGKQDWMKRSLDLMTDDVYVTLDLDAFDPAIMPATGTPEPGGLDYYTVINYLQSVFTKKNVVGFDIVELAPIEGMTAPQFLVAKLYYKMLSYKFQNEQITV